MDRKKPRVQPAKGILYARHSKKTIRLLAQPERGINEIPRGRFQQKRQQPVSIRARWRREECGQKDGAKNGGGPRGVADGEKRASSASSRSGSMRQGSMRSGAGGSRRGNGRASQDMSMQDGKNIERGGRSNYDMEDDDYRFQGNDDIYNDEDYEDNRYSSRGIQRGSSAGSQRGRGGYRGHVTTH